MAISVLRQDARYDTLKKGHNLRWPASEADAVGRIEICETAEEVEDALQRIVSAGLRPTVRSGGHCYEDFTANNPNGSLLDLGLLNQTNPPGKGAPYTIGCGTQLWQAYMELYKRYDVTLPGGTARWVPKATLVAAGTVRCRDYTG